MTFLEIKILGASEFFFESDAGDFYHFHGNSLRFLGLSCLFFGFFLLAGARKLFYETRKIDYWFGSFDPGESQESVYFRNYQGYGANIYEILYDFL